MSFGKPWGYSNSISWKKTYPAAAGKEQSPVNIDVDKTVGCDLLCSIAMKYSASKCNVRIQNKTPIINFDTGSYIKFIYTKEIYSLKSATIHVPSLHSVNGVLYDMEIVLYHKTAGPIFTGDKNYTPGGCAVSIMFQRGIDYGPQNSFFNSFVHKLPNDTEATIKELDIPVGDSWGPEMLIPQSKAYYYYNGSLPFPPCEENWRWIVFEDIQGISANIIDTLSIAFMNNTRPVKPLGTRVIAYNSKGQFPIDGELERKAAETKQKTDAARKSAQNSLKLNNSPDGQLRDETQRLGVIDRDRARTKEWYLSRKVYIKGILLTLVILLVLYAALRLVKYLVFNDLLNKVMVRQALGLTNVERAGQRDLSLEGQQMQQVQGQLLEQMAAQQAAAASGGPVPGQGPA